LTQELTLQVMSIVCIVGLCWIFALAQDMNGWASHHLTLSTGTRWMTF